MIPRCVTICCVLIASASLVSETAGERLPDALPAVTTRPSGDDYSATGLRRYQSRLLEAYGGDYRNIPLNVKAEYYEWVMWRYHLTREFQIPDKVALAEIPGVRPTAIISSDTSTWNGALLAALSYKYAVTKDPDTLGKITQLLQGLRFYSEVTGKPGCYARSIVPAGTRVPGSDAQKFGLYRYADKDGKQFLYYGNPAKGTYNQLAGGYATMMMFVYDDLPPDIQKDARRQVAELVLHVISDDYHIRNADGSRTPHGNLTPVVASVGVPFNGQVAYQIIALGHYFPGDDPAQRQAIDRQFRRLREKRHAYYKDPLKSLVRPQRVGNHPLVKGMNDRNHVTNAAYVGLAMEVNRARRLGRDLDKVFMYRLGRTMYWSMNRIGSDRNSLCNFMWAGMLSDAKRFKMILKPAERPAARTQIRRGLLDGIEQLRRYRLDRFAQKGRTTESDQLHWVDNLRTDSYHWKMNPKSKWEPTGPVTNKNVAAIGYLAAYWLLRYYNLDEHPVLQTVAR